jgi:Eukaryotic protein of unknown function (DUF846)
MNINNSAHFGVLMFLIIFKAAPIIIYILSGLVDSVILVISLTTLLAALDFWFLKNICGRKMVGLRWSRKILADGTDTYDYICSVDESTVNKVDKFFFWTT